MSKKSRFLSERGDETNQPQEEGALGNQEPSTTAAPEAEPAPVESAVAYVIMGDKVKGERNLACGLCFATREEAEVYRKLVPASAKATIHPVGK